MIANKNEFVKLPKLNIQKFYDDCTCTLFNPFWNIFKTSIYKNKSLSKIEKFHYLKSYLSSAAANCIEEFKISEPSYDSELKIQSEGHNSKSTSE